MMNYKSGLLQLEGFLKDRAPKRLPELHTLEDRFGCNEYNARVFGHTPNTQSEHAQIFYALDKLAIESCSISFGELCQKESSHEEISQEKEIEIHSEGIVDENVQGISENNQDKLEKPTQHLGGGSKAESITLDEGLVPSQTELKILACFKDVSNIGRYGVLREICGHKLPRPEIDHLLELLEQGERSLLLTDGPGSGKSWVLCELADRLEADGQWGVLFIKGDRYDDIDSEQDLLTRLRLPNDIVKLATSLTSHRKVAVILDSLDALSLSSNQKALRVFLELLDRLEAAEGIQIVAACRDFDLSYDPRLRLRKWSRKIPISALDFDTVVAPFLRGILNIDSSTIPEEQQKLLTIPGNLTLFAGFAGKVPVESLRSSYHFLNTFLEEVVRKDPELGEQALSVLQQMAVALFNRRSLFMPRGRFKGDETMYRLLNSKGVLQFDASRDRLGFAQQMMLDTLITKEALSNNKTLKDFLLEHPPLPFIRPAIRAFMFSLRVHDPGRFRTQIKQLFDYAGFAHHLKQLVAKSLAEVQPVSEDVSLCKWLSGNYPDYFKMFLWALENSDWLDLLLEPLFRPIVERSGAENLRNEVIAKLRVWMNDRPHEVIGLWNSVLAVDTSIMNEVIYALEKFKCWDIEEIPALFETLLVLETQQNTLSIGKSLSQYIEASGSGDELLWRFITAKVDETRSGHKFSSHLAGKLRCSDRHFHHKDFLKQRLYASDYLFSLCIEAAENWSALCYVDPSVTSLRHSFLDKTSWRFSHHKLEIYDASELTTFLAHIGIAFKERCKQYDAWWQANEPELRNTHDAGLAYLLIQAYRTNIEQNLSGIIDFLRRDDLFQFDELRHEIGELLQETFPCFDKGVQEEFQQRILMLSFPDYELDPQSEWILQRRYEYLCRIPNFFRLQEAQEFITQWKDTFGLWPKPPFVYSEGGTVRSPVSAEQLLSFSDDTLIRLFRFYDDSQEFLRRPNFLEGGTEGVLSEFKSCCALNPVRFLPLIERLYAESIYAQYAVSIIEGVATHLSYRFGNLRQPQEWQASEPLPEGISLASVLLKCLHDSPALWKEERAVATALQACAYVVKTPPAVRLLTRYFCRFVRHHEPENDTDNPNAPAFISIYGHIVEGVMVLAIRLLEQNRVLPEALFALLQTSASTADASGKASLLSSLPAFTYYEFEKGWQLFDAVFEKPDARLWPYTQRFLYYQYSHHFDRVRPYLERMKNEASEIVGKTWGTLNTLAYLSGHVTEEQLFDQLISLNDEEVWSGAVQVFCANINRTEDRDACENGILRTLQFNALPTNVLSELDDVFKVLSSDESERTIAIAESFIAAFQDEDELCKLMRFFDWIASLSEHVPLAALHLCEKFLDKIEAVDPSPRIFHGEGLISAYLQVMREADDPDTHDSELIGRAVSLQDRLLKLNLYGMWDALDKAGRA